MKKQFERPVIEVHAIATEQVMFEIGDFKGTWGIHDSGDVNNFIED